MNICVSHNLIDASAGTGKTYQLTSRFIALMALGAELRKMIALTFTNKAAGEFRNRIFQALSDGAQGKPDAEIPHRNALAVRIWETWTRHEEGKKPLYGPAVEALEKARALGVDPESRAWPEARIPKLDKAFFQGMLKDLVQHVSDLRLQTLDSFFNRIVSNSDAFPLRAMNERQTEKAKRKAMLSVLRSASCSATSKMAFMSVYEAISQDSGGGKMVDKLVELMDKYASLLYRHPDNEGAEKTGAYRVWGNLEPFSFPVEPTEVIKTDDDYKRWQDEIDSYLARFTKMGFDYAADFKERVTEQLQTFRSRLLTCNTINSLIKWSRNEKKIKRPKQQDAAGAYSLVQELRVLVRGFCDEFLGSRLKSVQLRTQAIYALACQYVKAYEREVLRAGWAGFDDIMRRANTLLKDPSMGCKMNSLFDHWLLDEFQDTSREQWETLRDFFEEIAQDPDNAKSLFVVGDAKQSIYGFRNASPELFLNLQKDQPSEQRGLQWNKVFQVTSLDKSRRSSKLIMDFVNGLFKSIRETEANDKGEEKKELLGTLEGFTKHGACGPMAEKRGYVRVSEVGVAGDKADEIREKAYDEVVNILNNELTEQAENGARRLKGGMTLAVLTGKNEEAAKIAARIRSQCPGLPVQLVSDKPVAEASPLGAAFMAFFRWLQHPADKFRLNVLQNSLLKDIFREKYPESDWQRWIDKLSRDGYAATIRGLVGTLPQKLRHERVVSEWLEAAYAFDGKGGSLDDWLLEIACVSSKGDPSPRYVQVMTMHKSKGMEFDAVIVPLLKQKNESDKLQVFLDDEENGLLILPGDSKKLGALGSDRINEIAEAKKLKRRQEDYNLLYVALTRAKRANYILIPKGKQPNDSQTEEKPSKNQKNSSPQYLPGAMLKRAVEGGGFESQQDGYVFKGSDENWMDDLKGASAKVGKHASGKLGEAVSRRRRVSPSKSESGEHSWQAKGQGDAAAAAKKAKLGTAVHALFEQLEWWNEGSLPPWCRHPKTEAEEMACAALQEPAIRRIFDKASFPEGTQVYNEQRVEAVSGAEWTSASIDRLIIKPDGSVLIVDYKTNKDASNLKEEYREQMSGYRKLVADALGIPLAKVEVCLVAVGCAAPHVIPVLLSES